MNDQLRVVIYKRKYIYDDLLTLPKSICEYKGGSISDNGSCVKTNFSPVLLCKKGFSAYLLSLYIYVMHHSNVYRKSALRVLKSFITLHNNQTNGKDLVILMKLRTPKYQFLDYSWLVENCI